jgi:hypothetical protein
MAKRSPTSAADLFSVATFGAQEASVGAQTGNVRFIQPPLLSLRSRRAAMSRPTVVAP